MPQATEELRAEWVPGDEQSFGEGKACKYLESQGYRLSREWYWSLPSRDHKPTEKEMSAIVFLIDEWDYGGFVPYEPLPLRTRLRNRIIRNIGTCTLWRADQEGSYYIFRPWPRWKVSHTEYMSLKREDSQWIR